jgi:hypothetical protein
MTDYNYKEEIRDTRKGYLGGSDFQMFSKINSLGKVPESCKERLAIVKGLYKKENDFSTEAMRIGDEVENKIFDILKSQDERWESNPRIESKKFKRNNVNLLCHPDFMLVDNDKKIVIFIECKATKDSLEKTRKNYNGQLYIENILGKEYTESIGGRGWRFNLKLCHYNPENYDGSIVDENIETAVVRFGKPPFNIAKCMDMIDDYLGDMTEYYRDDITEEYLPIEIKNKFDAVAGVLREIKDREIQVEEFKKKMFAFMTEKNIKSVKTENFTLTRIDETEINSFDGSRFKDEHRTLYKKYLKKITKKGYAVLKLK